MLRTITAHCCTAFIILKASLSFSLFAPGKNAKRLGRIEEIYQKKLSNDAPTRPVTRSPKTGAGSPADQLGNKGTTIPHKTETGKDTDRSG